MAEVRPLRGIRYAQERVGDIAQVVTPPYDVIDKEAQGRYYARNPYNIIRLELGQEHPEDTPLNNVYTRAAATFSEWRLQHILRQDSQYAYYLYQQDFSVGGQTYTRTSLLARVRLVPWSDRVILPHEHTLAKAKDDRLKLLRACAANFSPIMSLYDDPQGRIRRLLHPYVSQAAVQVIDEIGETHRLHPITHPEQLRLIQDFFAERRLYIADGHHRYETALAYRNELEEQRRGLSPEDAVNFVLMALIAVDDPGMVVLPTHRVLFGLQHETLSQLNPQQLEQYFTVQPLGQGRSGEQVVQHLTEAGQQNHSALVLSLPEQTWLLVLNERGRERMHHSGHADAWNQLDVAIAQTLVLEDLLRLTAEQMTTGAHVRYTRDVQQALLDVQKGHAQAALLLNPTRVEQIRDVALADERMPQKSTYFYPKLITGLVIHPLW